MDGTIKIVLLKKYYILFWNFKQFRFLKRVRMKARKQFFKHIKFKKIWIGGPTKFDAENFFKLKIRIAAIFADKETFI